MEIRILHKATYNLPYKDAPTPEEASSKTSAGVVLLFIWSVSWSLCLHMYTLLLLMSFVHVNVIICDSFFAIGQH